MQLYLIHPHPINGAPAQVQRVDDLDALPPGSFGWIDARRDEPAEPWREMVAALTGVRIHDAHMTDAANEQHPSFFDNTADYDMIVFRGLVAQLDEPPERAPGDTIITSAASLNGKIKPAQINPHPKRVITQPLTFLMLPRLLVTVRPELAPAIGVVRERLLSHATKLPLSPEDLTHRILNAMVDRYLELRQPLAERLDRLQRNLLDPRRPFNDWYALLEQRIEIRKLEHLCEEQRDAIVEWNDTLNERHPALLNRAARDAVPVDAHVTPYEESHRADLLRVRIADLTEHISRVLNHAQRLETTAESAVQLHFSAMAHRTSEIMRTLTILTAIFMPLNLITGIFGMNFKQMPLIENPVGFWWSIGAMATIVVGLLTFFRRKRYIETREERGLERKL